MASYRPFPPPPQSTFGPPPSQNPLPPPPLAPQPRANQYSQSWGGYGGTDGSFNSQQNYNPNQYSQPGGGYGSLPPPYPYPLPHPPPPPMNLPPAPSSMYYPSSTQYSQFNNQSLNQPPPPPPPPPSSPPPSSMFPPPPPPSQPPSPPPPPSMAPTVGRTKESRGHGEKGAPAKQHRPPVPPMAVKKSNGGRIEAEEERRIRKKRELEKQKHEEKQRQQLKESQNAVLQKTQMLSSGAKGHGSIIGSRMGERRSTPLLSGERAENRLKKPTTFICKLKFRNELPDPTAQPKLLSLRRDKDRFSKYTITSLEKMHKPQLYVEPDLGIPLDLLDLSVYNPPKGERLPLDPEDELLLRDDDPVTPVKKDGIKRKERPTDAGMSWLVKTQYISPLSMEATKQSMTEKQAKELREARGGHNLLENINNRERRIKEIEASFVACKSLPVHSTNSKLQPVEVLPLLPDFDRYDDQFVVATFDSAPTADSELYSKLDKSVRDAHESQAIMKSYIATGSDSAKPDKFLAYMTPSPNELSKDIYDENEDVSFSWIREYHWDVRGDVADDPTTYLVAFGESEAHYVPLPTKLILSKKRAKEGKSSDEVEHFPVPSRVTVRRRATVNAVEMKESESYPALKRGRIDVEDGLQRQEKVVDDQDMDQSSEAEYMSD